MKKVLFMIDSLCCGGAEKSLVSLLPVLDYTKMDVDLMIVSRGGVFEQYIPSNVHIVPFLEERNKSLLKRACQLLFSSLVRLMPNRHAAELKWITMGRMYSQFEKEYDVAIAYQQGFPTYYIAERVKAKKKIAWINVDLRKARYRTAFNRPFYNKMTKIVTVSDTLYNMQSDDDYVNKDKLLMIRDIVNVDVVTKLSQEKGFDDDAHEKGKIRIVTVGRLVPPKNYNLAVETAKLLREKGLSFRWYFVGEGSERQAIDRKIATYGLQDNVMLLGMQPNPYPYMKGCDVYVQTSSFEGFGLTISEAIILHKPIVSTNFPVVHDQIEDGVNGLISEMTADNLCTNILSLANNESLRKKLVEGTYRVKNTTASTERKKVNHLIAE